MVTTVSPGTLPRHDIAMPNSTETSPGRCSMLLFSGRPTCWWAVLVGAPPRPVR
jgi:hypothetical protein